MAYILALDQGTTSCRAVLFDQAGSVCSLAQQEFAQHFPQPGWVEHNAMDIWRSQLAVAKNCIRKSPAGHIKRRHTATDIVAIGIANQRETTVLWSRATGQPVAPAIVWQDRRTTAQCHALQAAGQAKGLHAKTGLVADAYFSATKLQWLLDNTPGARQQAERGELAFGTIDCWLVWNLTGGRVHATDASNASRTLLFNIHTLAWDAALLRLFDIPASVLPQVVPSSGVLGYTDAALFGAPIPIAGIAGDQQAATFGQACFTPGMAKNTYGTGCFMLMNTGTTAVKSRNRLLTTVAWAGPAEAAPSLPQHRSTSMADLSGAARSNPALPRVSRRTTCYALEGGVFMAGATVQWLRDGLQIIKTAAEVEPLAASVPDSGDVFLVPAFAGLGAPVWDGHARAIMLGMTRGTHRAHIARAALQAIAFQVADVFDAMALDAALPLTELRVDGGASANNLLMQIQADVLGVPVVRPRITETTALGAAYLAGLATGFWCSADEIAAQWAVGHRFEPRLGAVERAAQRARWQQAVQRARGWAVPV